MTGQGDSAPDAAELFAHDAFVVVQPFTWWVNRYFVHLPADDAFGAGELVGFARQKAFAFKEDLRILTGEDGEEILRIKARRVIDIGGRYAVSTPDGAEIGALQRHAKASILRTTWSILDTDGVAVLTARESSVPIAIYRRVQNVIQSIPVIGGLLGLLLNVIPIPYHFDLLDGDVPVGQHRRKTGIWDHYRMTIQDPAGRVDRRMLVALAVGLDALQSR